MLIARMQSVATFLPYFFFWGIFVVAAFTFFKTKENREKLRLVAKVLFWVGVTFRVLYASFLTIGQYIFWGGDAKTKIFLAQGIDPYGPIGSMVKIFPFLGGENGYFIFYAFVHFWVGAILAILCAVLFWWFLKILHKYRERFFENGEKELGATLALLAGWPGFILFLILTFFSVVLISLVRGVLYKEPYTTLGLPFLFASLTLLVFGKILLLVTGLSLLRITTISL
jgi:hypothetical protein